MLLNKKGFTVIEVLIVLYIISLLFGIFIYFWNTYGIFSKSRDSARLYSLNLIDSALKTLLSVDPNAYLGEENIIYISLPDTNSTCGSYNLIKLNPPFSYRCSSSPKNISGSGWIPIDFTQNKFLNISFLPVDPLNNQDYFFAYQVRGKRYKLTAKLESKNMIFQMANDGGFEPTFYEIGTDLFIPSYHSGLVGYWSFDEGSGNTAEDSSGNNNHGTLYNEPQWVNGKIGKALSFDGVDDYVEIPDSQSLSPTSITITLWVKQLSRNPNKWTFLISKTGWGSYNIISEDRWSTNQVGFTVKVRGVDYRLWTNNAIGNYWSFLAFTYDKSTGVQRTYFNGMLDTEQVKPAGPIDTIAGPLRITGARAYYFNGLIDEVRIYNRALSAEEIRALYEATK